MINLNGAPAQRPDAMCPHGNTTLPRARTVSNGAIQYRNQCLDCGKAVGQAIAKTIALNATNGNPEPFDEDLIRRKNEEFLSHYEDYLKSEEWNIKRNKIWNRCHGLCEGCAERQIVEVHHLTYDNIGNELLYELVGLCETCHNIAHKK